MKDRFTNLEIDKMEKPRILYVEDDPKSRLIIRKLLENAGCEVYEAADGREGIQKALKLNPDVILMDIMLPQMNGIEATRKLKETKETSKIPIIALTAKAMARDREKILASGCDEYIAKPMDISLLLQTLSKLLKKELSLKPQKSPQRKEKAPKALFSGTLLVVDDSLRNLRVLEKVFSSEGYRVLTAANGKAALEILRENKVDAIISDIVMPLMDGYQLCYEVMKNSKTRDIRFTFYSSHFSNEDEIEFGLNLGADCYMVRPLETKKLIDLVRNVLTQEKKQISPMSLEKFSELHSRLLTSKIIEIIPETESFRETETKTIVEMGHSYLVEVKTPERSYEIFLEKLSGGFHGLILTRTHPKFVRQSYNLEKTPFIWLSTTKSEEFKSSTDLTELSLSIKQFITKTEKSIILLDGYEFLASKMGSAVLLQFFQSLNEFISSHNTILLIPVDPEILNDRELHTLERELTSLS